MKKGFTPGRASSMNFHTPTKSQAVAEHHALNVANEAYRSAAKRLPIAKSTKPAKDPLEEMAFAMRAKRGGDAQLVMAHKDIDTKSVAKTRREQTKAHTRKEIAKKEFVIERKQIEMRQHVGKKKK